MAWNYRCEIIVNLTGPHDAMGSSRDGKREIYWPPFSCEQDQSNWPVQIDTVEVSTLDAEKVSPKLMKKPMSPNRCLFV